MSSGFWTLDRVAAALQSEAVGRLPRGAETLSGVTTDTRKIGKGNVFLALKGSPPSRGGRRGCGKKIRS